MKKKMAKLICQKLADELHLDANNLFPLTEVLDMLRFAKITDGENFAN